MLIFLLSLGFGVGERSCSAFLAATAVSQFGTSLRALRVEKVAFQGV